MSLQPQPLRRQAAKSGRKAPQSQTRDDEAEQQQDNSSQGDDDEEKQADDHDDKKQRFTTAAALTLSLASPSSGNNKPIRRITHASSHSPMSSSVLSPSSSSSSNKHFWGYDSDLVFKFVCCFAGLQVFYLSGAYLQELIMTTEFQPTPRNPQGRFPSATFCVFLNRCVALTVALVAVRLRHGAFYHNNTAPAAIFIPCALSNTGSSVCQYASLKYVSFPLMTVFKSCTIIPVMIMGYLIKGTTYPLSRFVEAALITTGVALFSMSNQEEPDPTAAHEDEGSSAASTTSTTMTASFMGMTLLVSYVILDSFTTQWQHKIYSMYGRDHVDPYQMMLGVDSIAIFFTTASLLASGEVPLVLEFLETNPHVLVYNLLCPILSTCGQLCIFYTIQEFGPIVFTVIMTTRKLFSIAISSIVFGHSIRPWAAMGGFLVLGAIGNGVHRMCLDQKHKQQQQQQQQQQNDNVVLFSAAVDKKKLDEEESTMNGDAAAAAAAAAAVVELSKHDGPNKRSGWMYQTNMTTPMVKERTQRPDVEVALLSPTTPSSSPPPSLGV